VVAVLERRFQADEHLLKRASGGAFLIWRSANAIASGKIKKITEFPEEISEPEQICRDGADPKASKPSTNSKVIRGICHRVGSTRGQYTDHSERFVWLLNSYVKKCSVSWAITLRPQM
jgi:hypothetical protein